jgi:hypothetical protein
LALLEVLADSNTAQEAFTIALLLDLHGQVGTESSPLFRIGVRGNNNFAAHFDFSHALGGRLTANFTARLRLEHLADGTQQFALVVRVELTGTLVESAVGAAAKAELGEGVAVFQDNLCGSIRVLHSCNSWVLRELRLRLSGCAD